MRQRSLSTAMTLALFGLPSIAFAQHLQVSPTLPSDEDRVLLVVSGYGCAPGEAEEIETAGEEMSGMSFGTSFGCPLLGFYVVRARREVRRSRLRRAARAFLDLARPVARSKGRR